LNLCIENIVPYKKGEVIEKNWRKSEKLRSADPLVGFVRSGARKSPAGETAGKY